MNHDHVCPPCRVEAPKTHLVSTVKLCNKNWQPVKVKFIAGPPFNRLCMSWLSTKSSGHCVKDRQAYC